VNTQAEVHSTGVPPLQEFEQKHYPVTHWAQLWGFSAKTVREWFSEETGAGILRQANTGRRSKRDYITLMISATAAGRVYARHNGLTYLRNGKVMSTREI